MIVPQRFTASASACPSACLSVPLFLSLCRLHAHTHTCASTCLLAVFVVSCAVELHLNARSRRLEQLLSATASLASFLQVGTFPPVFLACCAHARVRVSAWLHSSKRRLFDLEELTPSHTPPHYTPRLPPPTPPLPNFPPLPDKKETPAPVCDFLSRALPLWDGQCYRIAVLTLVAHAPPLPFEGGLLLASVHVHGSVAGRGHCLVWFGLVTI